MSLRVLIFATTYVATPERAKLLRQWLDLHSKVNPDCDLFLIDSASPLLFDSGCLRSKWDRTSFFTFEDNIGHLSQGAKDGWGRAFCLGLQSASNYDYVAHIEGDSLLRLPVLPIVEQMAVSDIKAASVPVGYGEAQRSTWVETGLMFFNVEYLKSNNFIAGYDWPNRTARPQPEIVIRKMLGNDLVMMSWKAERSDKGEITVDNVHEYDWITHCKPEVYDRFVEVALG